MADAVNYQGRKISRASGFARRQAILAATLRLIVRDGMRAIRHRAVATEAGVPLAATTYYFATIEDLITEAFVYWVELSTHEPDDYREACYRLAGSISAEALADRAQRSALAEKLIEITTDYIDSQVSDRYDNRVLELAFYHEAYNNPKLKAVVVDRHQQHLQDATVFHQMMGSAEPEADARITLSMILWLERDAVMLGPEAVTRDVIARVVGRHIRLFSGLA